MTHLNKILNVLLIASLFVLTQKTWDIRKWDETIPETMCFYILGYLIFELVTKFRRK